MKRFVKYLFIIIFLILITIGILFVAKSYFDNNSSIEIDETDATSSATELTEEDIANMPVTDFSVSNNGWLSVDGANLINDKKQKIQLSGISSHGIQWFYDVLTPDNIAYLNNDWGINVFRVAMYSEAYVSNPEDLENKLTSIVDTAIDLDMYVIIDWHILNDNDPNTYIEQANTFFDKMSLKYQDVPNVIYEICNEPNGNEITWEYHIKPYAQKIIPTIRNNSPKSLVIVGTPDYCKKLNYPTNDPLDFDNVAYACHFYAGSHGKELQELISNAINNNICIFVSECGSTNYTGDGQTYNEDFSSWIDFLNENNISWVYWSFANKAEGASILLPSYDPTNPDLNVDDYLTDFGKYLKNIFTSKKSTFGV